MQPSPIVKSASVKIHDITSTLIFTEFISKKSGKQIKNIVFTHTIGEVNRLGYLPFYSIKTGLIRSFLGLIIVVASLANAFFYPEQFEVRLKAAKFGAIQLLRGLVEAVPFLGNYTMYSIDKIRVARFESSIKAMINSNQDLYKNKVSLFYDGELRASLSMADFCQELETLQSKKINSSHEETILLSPKTTHFLHI